MKPSSRKNSEKEAPRPPSDLAKLALRSLNHHIREAATEESTITLDMVGRTFPVHTGGRRLSLYVTKKMIGRKLGEVARAHPRKADPAAKGDKTVKPKA